MSRLSPLSLRDTASYLPKAVIDNGFYQCALTGSAPHPLFRGTRLRHHIAPGERAADMIAHAAQKLIDRQHLDPARDIDVLLTNVSLPDQPFTGCGAAVAQLIGARPRHILDLSNGDCVSFLLMLEQARALFTATGARSALICNAQTAGGRIFNHPASRSLPQSALPGDGAGVAYVVADDSAPLLSLLTQSYPENANELRLQAADRDWWAPGSGALNVDFSMPTIAAIIWRANQLMPRVLNEALQMAGLQPSDVACLVTNQPNRTLLRNWREAMQLAPERHANTFDEHGDLFGAALPIGIERARDDGVLEPGEILLLGGFSHAGDYAAAAALRWPDSLCC
ncbi:3-oxoacyl-[acyl-carrier-protein] synthase III C-terminal domain-containing protein [Paucibacter sp. APW11]|uniref:3-oxoacyl-[acyl-carrier-protein] synthase III C-terminal domain-containing protein n=1 Tax=Roseateles aquae TaxID=3077235 RepID=A0ABU3P7U7_9BURK|nr:3-oxoacyl-[acyl-carrier-protein] synthase III C-terminal domain-containing protein [Paucibacter sp. APW11]MDT8998635.1 3-oxoacyl-[acyl-carrier-protein] synthase III C-terminal domain-containing protein [Paucibacter sp. APW11]